MATTRSPTRRLNQLACTAAWHRRREGAETGHSVDDAAQRVAQGTGPVGSAFPGHGALAYSLRSPQDARPPRGRRGVRTPARGAGDGRRSRRVRTTRERGDTGARRPFYFLQHFSKMQNSKFPNQS
jgi:hypothetical protein